MLEKIRDINIRFKVSLLDLSCITLFIVYGYFGYSSPKISSSNLFSINLLNLVIIGSFASLTLVINNEKYNYYLDKSINVKIISIVLLFFLINLTINYDYISIPLSGDELPYAAQSMTHAIKFIEDIGRFFWQESYFSVNKIIRLFNIIELALLLLMIITLMKIKNRYLKFFALMSITLLSRYLYSIMGGQSGTNSPLPSFPYQIFSSIFGVSDMGFRISSLLIVSIFQGIVWKVIYEKGKVNQSLIFLLLISIIPIFRVFFLSIEISLWAFYFTVITFLVLIKTKDRIHINLLYLAAIFSYFRFSILVIYFSIFILNLVNSRNKLEKNKIIITFLSLTIVLPNILSKHSVSDSLYGFDTNILYLQKNSIANIITYLEYVDSPIKIFFCVAILMSVFFICKDNIINVVFMTTWVSGIFLLFIVTLPSGLTHNVKYYSEWAFPLVVVFFYKIFSWLLSGEHRTRLAAGLYLLLFFYSGFSGDLFTQIKVTNPAMNQQSTKNTIYSFIPFKAPDYSTLHKVVKEQELKCHHVGMHFRQSEILHHITVKEYLDLKNSDNKFNPNYRDSFDVSEINILPFSGYNCLSVELPINENLTDELKTSSWEEKFAIKSFWGDSKVLVLIQKTTIS